MIKLMIDGSQHTGAYRVDCECGDNWSGKGEYTNPYLRNPALPIAECVVHMKLTHLEGVADVKWTGRFGEWLTHYWELANLRHATRLTDERPARMGS
jgi:hypothetical protein